MKVRFKLFLGMLIRAIGLFLCIAILAATAFIVFILANDTNLYHNKGTLKLEINGESIILEDAELLSDWKTSAKIHNNRFKFFYGHYGYNRFTLVIPKRCFKEYDRDVILNFGSFHVDEDETDDYKIFVSLNEENGNVIGECTRTDVFDRSDGSESSRSESLKVELDNENNVIDFVTEPGFGSES